MLKYLYIGFLAAVLLPCSTTHAKDNREYTSPVTLGALTVTGTGLGIVEPQHLDGSQIRQMQRTLTEKKFYNGAINGRWDNQTASAVENFQKAYSLWAEGLITTSTLAQLGVPVEIVPSALQSFAPAAGRRNP